MKAGDCLVVIPARFGSTRFEGKVLAKLAGRAIVEWCHRAAVASGVGPVLVATEDARVARAVEAFGGKAIMTSAALVSGTDRVHAAAKSSRARYVINLQGDEPLIESSTLAKVARILRENPLADLATAVVPLKDDRLAQDPNTVKAVLAENRRALYFSRSPIPYPRVKTGLPTFQHIGIYGFQRKALERFVRLPPSPLEKAESLEQLRALEAGMNIFAAVVSKASVAIDTPADLRRAETYLRHHSKIQEGAVPHKEKGWGRRNQ